MLHINLGKALMEMGQSTDALMSLNKANELSPNDAQVLLNLGICLNKLCKYQEALIHLTHANELKTPFPEVILNQALSFKGLDQYDRAIELCNTLLDHDPNNITAISLMGSILLTKKDYVSAIKYLYKSSIIDRSNTSNHSNLGIALINNNQIDEGVSSLQTALLINPNNIDALFNLSIVDESKNNNEAAIIKLNTALKVAPNNADITTNLAHLYLKLFKFELAWDHYSKRDLKKYINNIDFLSNIKKWSHDQGFDKLLVWPEQGVGDQILYSSLFTDLTKICTNPVIGLDKRLVALYQRSFPLIDFIETDKNLNAPDFGHFLPIADLAMIFRKDIHSFSPPVSFLSSNQNITNKFKSKFSTDKKVCGLSWFSNSNFLSGSVKIGQVKSISPKELSTLTALQEYSICNLQYDSTDNDLRYFDDLGMKLFTHQNLDLKNNIDGLASAIDACDLVLTVSNTTAHLAGALGKEVLLLLPFSTGKFWYWNPYEGRNLWYPNIKVFQQRIDGDWSHPLAKLQKYLELKIA